MGEVPWTGRQTCPLITDAMFMLLLPLHHKHKTIDRMQAVQQSTNETPETKFTDQQFQDIHCQPPIVIHAPYIALQCHSFNCCDTILIIITLPPFIRPFMHLIRSDCASAHHCFFFVAVFLCLAIIIFFDSYIINSHRLVFNMNFIHSFVSY